MHNSKIEQLLGFLKEEPNDPFTLYALALEYEAVEPEKTKTYFELLLTQHPDYLATYYLAGKFYEKRNKESSKKIYQDGMALALRQGKSKAFNELRNALTLLLDEEYD